MNPPAPSIDSQDYACYTLRADQVILKKHNKPVALMIDPVRFAAMDQALEEVSDILLGFEAQERMRNADPGDFIPLDKMRNQFR